MLWQLTPDAVPVEGRHPVFIRLSGHELFNPQIQLVAENRHKVMCVPNLK